MTKLNVEVADVLIARVADKEFRATVSDIPAASIEKILEYGFQRIVNDKTGGKNDPEKHKVAAATVARILDGTIAERSRAAGVDEWTRVARDIMRGIFKAKASADKRKEYKAADAEGRNAILDAAIDKNRTALEPLVTAEIERRKALRKDATETDIAL